MELITKIPTRAVMTSHEDGKKKCHLREAGEQLAGLVVESLPSDWKVVGSISGQVILTTIETLPLPPCQALSVGDWNGGGG